MTGFYHNTEVPQSPFRYNTKNEMKFTINRKITELETINWQAAKKPQKANK